MAPLANLLGNVAYELAAWDMEDRSPDAALDRQTRHDLARRALYAAQAAAGRLRLVRSKLHPVDLGMRTAKTDGRTFPLQGFQGLAELEGPVAEVLPWLLALSLGGGGQKRAMGCGNVRLWLGPAL